MSNRDTNPPRKVRALPPVTPADISVFDEGGAYVMRNEQGMALYQYDLDVDGRSHCVAACAVTWPPAQASADASSVVGDWSTFQRGSVRQWAYRGKPAYIYSQDVPGATKGNGIDGKWHLISV